MSDIESGRTPHTAISKERGSGASSRERRVALAPFQSRAVCELARNIATAHTHIAKSKHSERATIAREIGTSLLAAPTGSGKTLVLGRTLETLVPDPLISATGFRGTVWFWFAPYSGLVEQTRLALRAECPSLRLRDLFRDRDPDTTQDGDVFVHTWGSVAASNREARRLRRSNERALSVDDMIAELRDAGFFIGCVIDEAHLNFGTTAKAAASFYVDHLAPDSTLLATATPRDAKLDAFLRVADMGQPHRVEVARDDVIAAHLNKRGLIAAHLYLTEEQQAALDADETIIRAAWRHHEKIKDRLDDHGVSLIPLLLVQVANDADGTDEVERVKRALLESGVPEEAIRTHTSGQPDPEFHALSNDEDVEVLIFKLAAATGFDAPRAFSLVSLRPVVTPEFGLQIVGRVMRVDRRIRANPAALADPLLSRGTVFLAAPDRQGGLDAAASMLAAFKASVAPVTPQLKMVLASTDLEIDSRMAGTGALAIADSIVRLDEAASQSFDASISPRSRQTDRASVQIAAAMEKATETAAKADDEFGFGLFGSDINANINTGSQPKPKAGSVAYPLRRDLNPPERLMREKAPEPAQLSNLANEAARLFNIDERVISLLLAPITVDVTLRLRELLLDAHAERTERFAAVPSPAKLAEAAQRVFAFNEDIDPRLFRRRLVERFRATLRDRNGIPRPDVELARVIDSIAVFQPTRIQDALNRAVAAHVQPLVGEPLPDAHWDVEGLHEAKRGLYGVFPSGMNGPERRFAEWLDDADGVQWWLRNPSNPHNRWAVRLVLSNGAGFHPDFVVGVSGRRTPDNIRLAEVKDDGVSGRLHSDDNRRKVRARHATYFDVLFVAEDDEGKFHRLRFSEDLNRILASGRLIADDLRD